MPSVRCPRCERPVAVPDHPGGGWVRCPACRIPFEVGAGGEGFGPRWVLLPLWPWYAVAVFPLLMSLTRLNGSELLWWVVLPPVLLNLALSASNARACGRVWAAARARGGRVGLPGWCGAAHSALGFTWCWLFTLAPLADGRMRLWLDVGLVWGCLLIAPSVLVSGLVITAGSWSDAHRAGGALRHAVAAYDTLATVYNSCAVVADICVFVWAFAGGLPWAPRVFATIMEGFAGFINFGQPGGTEKPLVPALLVVVAALGAGVLSTAAIARLVAGARLIPSPDWRRLARVLGVAARVAAALLLILLLLLGVLLVTAEDRPCPVTRAAYERIEPGMTPTQVWKALGGPPGDYRTIPVGLLGPDDRMRIARQRNGHKVGNWEGNEGLVLVNFNPTVTWKEFVEPVQKPGTLELLCWRLLCRWDALRGRDGQTPPRSDRGMPRRVGGRVPWR